jgi:DNA helicase-2/ATP-dependent DNA helicase PcrA
MMDDSMDDLTPAQRAAVEHLDGPLLVVAGPGSGKTRVVTRRIARMIQAGIAPHEILAITFTNKAADEMQRRVAELLPGVKVWVSTFHRFCAHLLRRWAGMIGLESNYTILDTGDQRTLLRRTIKDLDFDSSTFTPEIIGSMISRAKNDLITPHRWAAKYEYEVGNHLQAAVGKVYPEYQKRLIAANGVDFDDLLLHVATLLDENPELAKGLGEKYQYVLVDEFQDTNLAQYQTVAAIAHEHRNLCVTGDPDQSIYSWRGARIGNILKFEHDFPGTKVVRLEDNFRSTKAILRSADKLISNNTQRKEKRLIAQLPEGEPVTLMGFEDGIHEAEGITDRIQQLVRGGQLRYGDFAVCFRVNAMSRLLETSLRRNRIPFRVAAGVAFFERAEVRDLIGYLRLIENPADVAAFQRVVNTPARRLGEQSQLRLLQWSHREGVTPLEACRRAAEVPRLSKQAVKGFQNFAKLMAEFTAAATGSIADLLKRVVDQTEYMRHWQSASGEAESEREAYVDELIAAAHEHDVREGADTSLTGFLETTSLVSDSDAIDDDRGHVLLLTLHATKGLEFPAVFIVGLEQGILPHERSMNSDDPHEEEEERRLLFVGMTRAKRHLFLTHTRFRVHRGQPRQSIPSPFLNELEVTQDPLYRLARISSRPWNTLQTGEFQFEEQDDARDLWSDEPAEETPVQETIRVPRAAPRREKPRLPHLTTGAHLLEGSSVQVALPTCFAEGMQVRHPRYGVGTVTSTSLIGQRRIVTVRFDDSGRTENFIASKAPLQPIG